ncbi:MAG: hypothetical protein AAGC46_17370, partial [Solirubrobacteraceae bacterium]
VSGAAAGVPGSPAAPGQPAANGGLSVVATPASGPAAVAATRPGDPAPSAAVVDAVDGKPAPVSTPMSPATAQSLQQQALDPNTFLQPPYASIPLPGGAQARMWLDPDGSKHDVDPARASDRARTMVVRYESPALGRMDVVLRLEPEKLETAVLAQAGHPIAQVRAAIPALRSALLAATGRDLSLTTGGRATDPVSVNA